MTDRAGQQLGNYRLLRFIGEGGFSDVYLGEHIFLKTQAAVKLLKMQLDQQDLENFLAEARTSASLEHPNIVRMLECGVEGGIVPYLVMSYAPGGTVRRRYPKGSRLPFATILSYTKQIASALQYVHERGLIHRDVKPENMLLGRKDEVMLSDFGIAATAHRTITQHTQEIAGTALYMAPEQLQGKPRPASDQYALAAVVYEWLCGERLFQGALYELYSQHLLTPPPPLHTKMPSISPAIEQVVMKALAKEPQQRFARVQDFADALELASQSQQAPPQFLPSPANESPIRERQLPRSEPPAPQVFPPELHARDMHQSIDPRLAAGRVTSRNKLQGTSKSNIALLLILLLFVIGASIGVFSFLVLKPMTPAQPTPVVTTPIDSPVFGFDVQHTHFNPAEKVLGPANVARLVPYWTVTTGSSIKSSPVLVDGVVYVGSDDHKLYAFAAKTGTILWMVSTGDRIFSSPAVADGVVYVGSDDGKLYAFNAKTGAIVWMVSTAKAIGASPMVVNGMVYVGSNDGKLYAFNAKTGAIVWTALTGSSIGSSPAVANGIVYMGSDDHKLYAFNAQTGATVWMTATGDRIGSSPAVTNGVVYVGSFDGKLYAFDARTGAPVWKGVTGKPIDSSPAVANGLVYIGSFDGKLYAFDARTGAVRWTAPAGISIASSPIVANGVVYIGADDHKLYAFDAMTGALLWSYTTRDRVSSSPTVVNAVVYVGSWDGKLYAFHLPSL